MIRDPSDGSVKEQFAKNAKNSEKPIIETPNGTTESVVVTNTTVALPDEPVLDTDTSGLPLASTKAGSVAKLEKSRAWLRDYRAGKIKPAIRDGE